MSALTAGSSGQTFKISVIPGDGIGVEVTHAALEVLDAVVGACDVTLEIDVLPWGSDLHRRTGRMMPADGLERVRESDAILFGAVGSPEIPDHITLWGLRLAICQGLDQYVAVRPSRRIAGVPSPLASQDLFDFVVVRENTEGEYAGAGGRVHQGLPSEVAVQTALFSRAGSERVVRFAFDLARSRRGQLTNVTKNNAQQYGMGLWNDTVDVVAGDYPDVAVRHLLVDAAAARLVLDPADFDVLVASNLFGDILSDIGGALTGSLGLAASANLDPTRTSPSMFEPVHGSAPDIAGRGIANPVGMIASAALMLDHLGAPRAVKLIEDAVQDALAAGARTPDVGGQCSTSDVTAEIVARVKVPRPARPGQRV